jgi:GTP-binding protein
MFRVALIGRPNVGKSSLFNRLAGKRLAIVEDTPGVTRDRHTAHIELEGKPITLIDTGGFLSQAEGLEAQVVQQVQFAIQEADLILWIVDAQTGLLGEDFALQAWLHRNLPPDKPLWLVVNKSDDPEKEIAGFEAFRLGIEPVFFVSAANGRGIAALKSAIAALAEKAPPLAPPTEAPCFAIIGRPNVGKSSLFNALLGEARAIVSDTPGTTRDALYMPATWQGKPFFWIDTAGLRRKSHIPSHSLERYSALRSLEALELSDVVLLTMDAQEALTAQDLALLRLAEKRGKGIVFLLNKADLIDKKRRPDIEAWVRQKVLPLEPVPVIWTSALTGEGVHRIAQEAFTVYEAGSYRIPTRQLNDTLRPILRSNPHPISGTLRPAVKFLHQIGTHPPTFQLHVRHKDKIRQSYLHFLMRQIRKNLFAFPGWMLRFELVEAKD